MAADAQGAGTAHTASLTLSRHVTTNALDRPLALTDWYTALRGSIDSKVGHELGSSRVSANLEIKRYDTYAIENDIALGGSTETTIAISDNLELRGTLAAQLAEEGDDLFLGDDVFIGIRTRKIVLSAGLQAGLRLDAATVLALEGSVTREKPEDTYFEDGLLAPVRLDPDRDRFRAGAKLTRTHGTFSYGGYGAAGLMRSDPIGFLPQLDVLAYAAGAHAGMRFSNGAAVAASIGLHALRLLDSAFQEQRLTYELAAETPLPGGFSLRGVLKADYDPKTNDDPVATWVRRLELEAGYQHTPALRFGTGLFAERRENVGLENTETARGLYAEAGWQATRTLALSLRVDAIRKILEELGLQRDTVDVHLAVSAKL